jgi:hypothetical protein
MDVCQDNTAALFNCIAQTEKSGPTPIPTSAQKMAPPVVFQAPQLACSNSQQTLPQQNQHLFSNKAAELKEETLFKMPFPKSNAEPNEPPRSRAAEVAATEAQPNLEKPKPKEDFSVFCEPTILQSESMMPEVTSTMTGLSQAINKNRRMSVFILHFYMNFNEYNFIDIPRWGMRCHCCRAACPL